MAKLYYGNGNCTINGSDIRGVEIGYTGAIEITDKTDSNFTLISGNNKIIIFPIGEGTLNDLFDYEGEFKIRSVIVADNNAEKVRTTIHRVMDYSELLNSNAEDMTMLSEELNAGYGYGKRTSKTSSQEMLNNLSTSGLKGGEADRYQPKLYLEDGTQYRGYFHVHLEDGGAMTGGEHSAESQDLYFKLPMKKKGKTIDKLISTKNPSRVPLAVKYKNYR